ncbi:hypothetical protein [Winogradskyella sp. Asnod2-B02-A]|uniref:hypothetical protein n=1 Tax=Winogradskyella sp. Asnod2-B02-A TaxID=3160583 RepID=UPI00386AFAC3
MNKIIKKLDSKSEQALNYMLNKSVQSIKSGNFQLDVRTDFILTTTISINISREEYLIITNEWSDTQKEGINYFELNARIEKKPADIKTKKDPKLKNSLIHYPNFSSLLLGATSKLTEIIVYERIEKGEIEEVKYDSAIFFKRADNLCFLIKNDDSITGYLKLVTKDKQIEIELSELKQRIKI